MAAPKGKDKLDKLFDEIIIEIAENGKSLIASLKNRMSTATFYELLKDSEKLKIYARACDDRAEILADEILTISDEMDDDIIKLPDGREIENQRAIQRDRLRVDARKWLLSKLHPKKYGDKIDITTKDQPINEVKVTFIDKTDDAGDRGQSGTA